MSQYHLFIPAAGRGSRMNAPMPKQYLHLGDQTVLEHTLNAFSKIPFASKTLGIAPDDLDFAKIQSNPNFQNNFNNIKISDGGAERADTVRLGLMQIAQYANPNDWVWVHDAARPCVFLPDLLNLKNILENINLENLAKNNIFHGAILACAVSETVKQSQDGKQIQATLPRQNLYLAQTPQAFRLGELLQALNFAQTNQITVTDEASAMEVAGYGVQLVLARRDNLKITYPEDVALAAAILAAR